MQKNIIFFFSFGCPNFRWGGGSTWLGQNHNFFHFAYLEAPLRFSNPLAFGSQAGTGPLSVSFLIRTSVKQARLAGPCLQRAHFRVLGSVQLTAKISGSKGPLTSNFIFKLDLHLLESVWFFVALYISVEQPCAQDWRRWDNEEERKTLPEMCQSQPGEQGSVSYFQVVWLLGYIARKNEVE